MTPAYSSFPRTAFGLPEYMLPRFSKSSVAMLYLFETTIDLEKTLRYTISPSGGQVSGPQRVEASIRHTKLPRQLRVSYPHMRHGDVQHITNEKLGSGWAIENTMPV